MSETATVDGTMEAPVKATKSKKVTKVKEIKAEAPKATTTKPKASAKPSTNGHSDGLRKPQVRILKALSKTSAGYTRTQISDKAEVDQASLSGYVGSYDEAKRKKDDKRVMSLLTLGYVKLEQEDRNGKDIILHLITAKGTKALEKANAK